MQATTVKIEAPLLKDLKAFIPKRQSISAFVREVLANEVQRRQSIAGAEAYTAFLQANPEEQTWLEEWESADLMKAPKPLRKKSSRRRS